MIVHSGTGSRREAIGADLAALVTDMGFALWRLRHRGAPFGEFRARLAAARHKTPDSLHKWIELPPLVAPSDSPELRRRGRNLFEWFRSRNLRRDMTCIDYGCGRLRVGQHFIDYLDTGRYLGLDLIDNFYREGLTRISGKVIARSQPRFLTIGAEALGRAREMRADLIFSTAVVQHVPPRELATYFNNIIAMMDKHSTAIVHFKAAPMTTRIAAVSWAHSPASLIAAISESDSEMHARIEDAGPSGAGFHRDALIFSRDAGELSKWLRKLPAEAPGNPMKGGKEEAHHVI
jgi:hypothetical protein